MTASYLFGSDGLKDLARYVAPDTLFALNLDAVLTIGAEKAPANSALEPFVTTLKRLDSLAPVAVITGSPRNHMLAMLGFVPRLLIGNHGAEWPSEESNRNWHLIKLCLKWQEQLYEKLCHLQEIEIEFKGESISIHYHKSENPKQALSDINAAVKTLNPFPQRTDGYLVVNLLPSEVLTKGRLLVAVMENIGAKRAVFISEDVANEELYQMNEVDVFGIHIGTDNQTSAPYYLKKPTALLGLLNSIVGILETYGEIAAQGEVHDVHQISQW